MKYLILLYAEEGAWPPDEHRIALQRSIDLCHELNAEGKYVSAAPLQPISTAVSVRVRDGKTYITDGPFAETKEHLGGYFLVDVANLDEAIRVASQIPGATRGTAEVRPIVELDSLPTRS